MFHENISHTAKYELRVNHHIWMNSINHLGCFCPPPSCLIGSSPFLHRPVVLERLRHMQLPTVFQVFRTRRQYYERVSEGSVVSWWVWWKGGRGGWHLMEFDDDDDDDDDEDEWKLWYLQQPNRSYYWWTISCNQLQSLKLDVCHFIGILYQILEFSMFFLCQPCEFPPTSFLSRRSMSPRMSESQSLVSEKPQGDRCKFHSWGGHEVDVSENRGGPPKSSILNRVFHYKPSILGYPYFWKHLNLVGTKSNIIVTMIDSKFPTGISSSVVHVQILYASLLNSFANICKFSHIIWF